MTLRWLCAAAILLTAMAAEAADFKVRRYTPTAALQALEATLDTTTSYSDQCELAREYRDRHGDDMTVQLRAAGLLAMDDLDSTRAYYESWAAREPQSVIALYLAGRLQESPDQQRRYAEEILSRDARNYWGNLLLAASQTAQGDPTMKKSEAALLQAISVDNSLPFAVERLGHLYRTRGDTSAADEVYVKLGEMQPDRFEPVTYRIMLKGGDQQAAIALTDEFLKKNPKNIDALYTKARAERERLDWNAHIATMRRIVETEPKGEYVYDLACGFSLAGQSDSAFARLFQAAHLGFADLEQYTFDDDLIPLRESERWSTLLADVENAERERMREFLQRMAETAPQRRQDALAERTTLAAPDFTFKDLQGNTVSLAQLRGQVVILDFWATWCGPCRKTMPLLDKFYTDSLPAGVVVYGMNVWERGGNTDKVRPFIEERGFHFPILLGDNDIATAYGVRGIPTLVVIDQEGRIAYRHVGYDPTLPEVLSWQTKELLNQ
ncbi:MAG: redoxin domain-containing protein [bacterium]|nr:redoxin domain-containing protein [bacterium]